MAPSLKRPCRICGRPLIGRWRSRPCVASPPSPEQPAPELFGWRRATRQQLADVSIVWHACAMEHTYDFDLAVMGSGPGGQKASIMAAKLGYKVCVIDSKSMVGGVCVNTGTIPSKTLREAVLYLTGMQLRDLYGASYRVKDEITISDLLARLQHVVGRETEVIRSQLMRNHIELVPGAASFLDPHTLTV